MTSKLGVYWSVMHRRQQDYDFFKRLQPSVFKIMDGGAPDYQFAKDNLPNSLVIARDWALSEQHSDMLKDPEGTGKRHAQEWNEHQARLGFDRAKTLILGINEPHIWEPGVAEALRQYTIALCDEATRLGLRVGAMQLSVGWPNNDGPDTPPNWSMWHGVDNAIRHNNGALVTHEYWADNGPSENWGWWAGRVLKCPWQVPIAIGETGVDMFVKDTSVGQQNRGWLGHLSPERYAAELADYVGRMSADSRFVGCAVFAADFASHEWFSFDIEPAYKAILATPIPDAKPFEQPIPVVIAPPAKPEPVPYETKAYEVLDPLLNGIVTAATLNVRSGPGVSYPIVRQLAQGDAVSMGSMADIGYGTWFEIAPFEWAKAEWIRRDDDPTADHRLEAEDKRDWARSLAFVLEHEGGWADDPNDPGGATMKGITIGTYTRWRELQGQPVPTKDDLRAIADEEVGRIYFEWYWLPSSANTLPWPMCLSVMDLAVNGGVGRAQEAFAAVGHINFLAHVAWRLDWYTRINGWKNFGAGWTRRVADLLKVASA